MSINFDNTKLPVSIHYSNGAGVTLPVGFIFPAFATDTYTPNGSVPVNGKEYSQDEFPTVYTNYLIAGKLPTCTYTEFTDQVTLTGNCGKFALDTVNKKFKVPLLKDGDSITHAATDIKLSKSVKAGLPDISGAVNGTAVYWDADTPHISGGFAISYTTDSAFVKTDAVTQSVKDSGITFSANRSNSIY